MKKMNTNEIKALARRGLVLMLVAVMVIGILPTGSVLATETPGESSEPTVETTVAAEETTAPSETTEATEAPSETTQPSETTEPSTEATEPSTEAAQPSTEATDPTEESTEATEASGYEQIVADLDALAEEAKTLEATVEACDAFYAKLMMAYSTAYDLNEVGKITDAELEAIDEKVPPIVEFLKDEYGYVNGNTELLATEITRTGSSATPLPADRESVPTLGNNSGITFRLYNYTNGVDADGNYVQAGGINDNGLYDYFNFRGTSYENTGADGKAIGSGANESCDVDGFPTTHATVEKTLNANGYPVYDAKRADSTGAHNLSLGYLFGEGGKGVTAYAPNNTLLRYDATTGKYYYNSADNAVDYDTATNNFIVRTYKERGASTAGYAECYDFFPFTYWNGTTKQKTANGAEYFYTNTEEVDYWYGMTMEATFRMPKDGKVEITDSNGNVTYSDEMKFEFSGDDDVWVFIDGVLVLDLGGTHGVVSGSINFATGQVLQYLDWNGSNSNDEDRTTEGDTSFPTTIQACFDAADKTPNGGWSDTKDPTNGKLFKDYTKHTIKFYYLERATSCANCKITFNMPILPTGEVIVDKVVDGTLTAETEKTEYEFVLYNKETNDQASPTVAGGVNYSVTRIGDSTVLRTSATTAEGKFYLKAGERATFALNMGEYYSIEETNTGDYTDAYECKLNEKKNPNSNKKSEEFTPVLDSTVHVEFINKLKTTDFTVSKTVTGNMGDRSKAFTFTAELKDANGAHIDFPAPEADETYYLLNENYNAVFKLKHGESRSFDNIPLGSYITITEVSEADDSYDTTYEIKVPKGGGEDSGNGNIATISELTSLDGAAVEFINDKEVTIDTGISFDAAPFVLILAIAAGGFVLLRKRRSFDD